MLLAAVLLSCMSLVIGCQHKRVHDPSESVRLGSDGSVSVGHLTVRVVRRDREEEGQTAEHAYIVVERSGREVYSDCCHARFFDELSDLATGRDLFGVPYIHYSDAPSISARKVPIPPLVPGHDATGDGTPNIVYSVHPTFAEEGTSGETACVVLQIGDEITQIARLEGCTGVGDLNGDGILEFKVPADTSRYAELYAEVPLNLHDRQWVPAYDAMETLRPTDEQIARWASELREESDFAKPGECMTLAPGIASYIAELVISDHGDRALKLYDQIWPDDVPGEDRCLCQITRTIHEMFTNQGRWEIYRIYGPIAVRAPRLPERLQVEHWSEYNSDCSVLATD